MQLVRVRITDPQDILDTFGAGAKYRIERGTTSAMVDAGEITTGTIVAGTTEYEYSDATGVAGSHWYRVRYSTATPTLSTHYSGYGPVFEAGGLTGQVIALETAKNYSGISDTDDDTWLPMAVGAINRAGVRLVGIDLSPSPDTTRTYDACEAKHDGRRLWIPGGIRAFTTVEVSYDASTWTDITSYVRVGPLAHSRPPGEPGHYIEYTPYVPGFGSFAYYNYVRITGTAFATFGWDAWPDDLVQDALVGIQRMSKDRSGQGAYPTETSAMRYLTADVWRGYSSLYTSLVR